MVFGSTTRAAEDKTRWKEIVVKSTDVSQQPCRVMGKTRLISEVLAGSADRATTCPIRHITSK